MTRAWVITQFLLQGHVRGWQTHNDSQNPHLTEPGRGGKLAGDRQGLREEPREGGFPTEFLPHLDSTTAQEPKGMSASSLLVPCEVWEQRSRDEGLLTGKVTESDSGP